MYTITEEKKIVENTQYTVYGIRYNNEYHIHDVSGDREAVERLANSFNRYRLDPLHLYDAVMDFIEGV